MRISFLTHTPKRYLWLVLYALFVLGYGVYATYDYYVIEAETRHSYPPDGDAIMIPIAGYAMGCLLFLIPYIAFMVWLRPRYAGATHLFAWNKNRPWFSAIMSVLALLFIAGSIPYKSLLHDAEFLHYHLPELINALLGIHVALLWQSAIVNAKMREV